MSSLLKRFEGHLNALNTTRKKVEGLQIKGFLVRRDIERIYEGIFLDAITSMEAMLEKMFIRYLMAKDSSMAISRIQVKSPIVAREILLGGDKKYLDWLPYEKTEKRARAFLRAGRPFTQLDDTYKKTLSEMLVIRNAIAHQSSHAEARFEKMISGQPLLPHEKTPAGYLRSKIDPSTTRYQFYVAEMAVIIRCLQQEYEYCRKT